MRLTKEGDRVRAKHLGLVETAIEVFGPVKRDRNDEHFSRRLASKLRNGLGQSATQFARCGNKAAVFQGVNGVLQARFVWAVSDRAHKRWRGQPTNATYRRAYVCYRTINGIATAGAGIPVLDRNLSPAGIADWHRGKARQRGAAKGAGSRKEDATGSIYGTSENTNNRTPTGSFRWWNVERQRTGVTVEDAPHSGEGETARNCRQILV